MDAGASSAGEGDTRSDGPQCHGGPPHVPAIRGRSMNHHYTIRIVIIKGVNHSQPTSLEGPVLVVTADDTPIGRALDGRDDSNDFVWPIQADRTTIINHMA